MIFFHPFYQTDTIKSVRKGVITAPLFGRTSINWNSDTLITISNALRVGEVSLDFLED